MEGEPNTDLVQYLRNEIRILLIEGAEGVIDGLDYRSEDHNLDDEITWTKDDILYLSTLPIESWLGDMLPEDGEAFITDDGAFIVRNLPHISLAAYLSGIIGVDIEMQLNHHILDIPEKWSEENIQDLAQREPENWLGDLMYNISQINFEGRSLDAEYKYKEREIPDRNIRIGQFTSRGLEKLDDILNSPIGWDGIICDMAKFCWMHRIEFKDLVEVLHNSWYYSK